MNTKITNHTISTRLLHSGGEREWQARCRAVPIYQTGSYIFQNSDLAAQAFNLEVEDHIYRRISNPTVEVLEKKIAAMDNGKSAVAFSSGMAAISNTILNICSQGDHIVSSSSIYGGTHVLFDKVLRKLGIQTHFVDCCDRDEIEEIIAANNAKLFFTESVGNPKNDIPDFHSIADICEQYNIPFICDNSLTPTLINPIELGIDIVIYSLSKYTSGHGLVIGGAVVEMGNFEWKQPKYNYFSEPDSCYNNIIFGDRENPFSLRLRAHMLRNFGSSLSPLDAFLSIIGMETLDLRMEKTCSNAQILATRLSETDGITWVSYPGIGMGKKYSDNLHYLNNRGGGIVCFGLGSPERSKKFADNLQLITHMANMGDVRSLIQHCASTSHAQLTEQELIQSGTLPDLLRFSVGIEDVEDLWDDIISTLSIL